MVEWECEKLASFVASLRVVPLLVECLVFFFVARKTDEMVVEPVDSFLSFPEILLLPRVGYLEMKRFSSIEESEVSKASADAFVEFSLTLFWVS